MPGKEGREKDKTSLLSLTMPPEKIASTHGGLQPQGIIVSSPSMSQTEIFNVTC